MKQMEVMELTPDSFKEYGYVISQSDAQPNTNNEEFTYWGKVSQSEMSKLVSTGVLVCHERQNVVEKLERHVNTPEILAALEGDSVICVGKRHDGTGSPSEIKGIKAFRIKQGDAICMYSGTWHWIPFPENCKNSKFMVAFASGTEDNDLEIVDLPEKLAF